MKDDTTATRFSGVVGGVFRPYPARFAIRIPSSPRHCGDARAMAATTSPPLMVLRMLGDPVGVSTPGGAPLLVRAEGVERRFPLSEKIIRRAPLRTRAGAIRRLGVF